MNFCVEPEDMISKERKIMVYLVAYTTGKEGWFQT